MGMYKVKRDSFYHILSVYAPLSQEEIVSLYEKEGVTELSPRQELNAIQTRISSIIGMPYEFLDNNWDDLERTLTKDQFEELQALDSRAQKLAMTVNNEFKKILSSINGVKPSKRKYPSASLQEKVFLGNLYLVEILAKMFYKSIHYRAEYDDIFQVAAMTLFNATYYYVPSERAKFTTYASQSIKRELARTFTRRRPKERRKTLEKELEQVQLAQMFTDAHLLPPRNHSGVYDLNDFRLGGYNRFYTYLIRFNHKIKDFNQELLALNRNIYPRAYQKKDISSIADKYQSIVNCFFKYLKGSMAKILIGDEDRNLVSQYMALRHIQPSEESLFMMREFLAIYLNKLETLSLYLKIFETWQNNNAGLTPSAEDMLKEMNAEVKRFNKQIYYYRHSKVSRYEATYVPPKSYYQAYMDEYGVDFLHFADNNMLSRSDEIKEIADDLNYKCLMLKDLLEELIQSSHSIKDEKIILELDDGYYYYSIASSTSSDTSYSYEEAIAHLKALIKDLQEHLDKHILDVLTERRNVVRAKLKEVNNPIYIRNQKAAYNIRAKQAKRYARYYTLQDIQNIEKTLKELYELEEETSLFKHQTLDSHIPLSLTLEEEVMNNSFLVDYYQTLNSLPPQERTVLLLWFDSNGLHSYTAQEISNKIGVSVSKVYKLKQKALSRLAKNKVMQDYQKENE